MTAVVTIRYFLADIENENYDPGLGDTEVSEAEFEAANGTIVYGPHTTKDSDFVGRICLTKNLITTA